MLSGRVQAVAVVSSVVRAQLFIALFDMERVKGCSLHSPPISEQSLAAVRVAICSEQTGPTTADACPQPFSQTEVNRPPEQEESRRLHEGYHPRCYRQLHHFRTRPSFPVVVLCCVHMLRTTNTKGRCRRTQRESRFFRYSFTPRTSVHLHSTDALQMMSIR